MMALGHQMKFTLSFMFGNREESLIDRPDIIKSKLISQYFIPQCSSDIE